MANAVKDKKEEEELKLLEESISEAKRDADAQKRLIKVAEKRAKAKEEALKKVKKDKEENLDAHMKAQAGFGTREGDISIDEEVEKDALYKRATKDEKKKLDRARFRREKDEKTAAKKDADADRNAKQALRSQEAEAKIWEETAKKHPPPSGLATAFGMVTGGFGEFLLGSPGKRSRYMAAGTQAVNRYRELQKRDRLEKEAKRGRTSRAGTAAADLPQSDRSNIQAVLANGQRFSKIVPEGFFRGLVPGNSREERNQNLGAYIDILATGGPKAGKGKRGKGVAAHPHQETARHIVGAAAQLYKEFATTFDAEAKEFNLDAKNIMVKAAKNLPKISYQNEDGDFGNFDEWFKAKGYPHRYKPHLREHYDESVALLTEKEADKIYAALVDRKKALYSTLGTKLEEDGLLAQPKELFPETMLPRDKDGNLIFDDIRNEGLRAAWETARRKGQRLSKKERDDRLVAIRSKRAIDDGVSAFWTAEKTARGGEDVAVAEAIAAARKKLEDEYKDDDGKLTGDALAFSESALAGFSRAEGEWKATTEGRVYGRTEQTRIARLGRAEEDGGDAFWVAVEQGVKDGNVPEAISAAQKNLGAALKRDALGRVIGDDEAIYENMLTGFISAKRILAAQSEQRAYTKTEQREAAEGALAAREAWRNEEREHKEAMEILAEQRAAAESDRRAEDANQARREWDDRRRSLDDVQRKIVANEDATLEQARADGTSAAYDEAEDKDAVAKVNPWDKKISPRLHATWQRGYADAETFLKGASLKARLAAKATFEFNKENVTAMFEKPLQNLWKRTHAGAEMPKELLNLNLANWTEAKWARKDLEELDMFQKEYESIWDNAALVKSLAEYEPEWKKRTQGDPGVVGWWENPMSMARRVARAYDIHDDQTDPAKDPVWLQKYTEYKDLLDKRRAATNDTDRDKIQEKLDYLKSSGGADDWARMLLAVGLNWGVGDDLKPPPSRIAPKPGGGVGVRKPGVGAAPAPIAGQLTLRPVLGGVVSPDGKRVAVGDVSYPAGGELEQDGVKYIINIIDGKAYYRRK